MFELVTRLVLWILLAYFIWYVLIKLVPQVNLKWFVPVALLVLVMMGLAFPNDRGIATAWNIISFPLKPIGLCIILLVTAASQAKEKKAPKGLQNMIRTVLTILLIASIPWISEKLEYSVIRSNINHAEICPDNPNFISPVEGNTLIVMLANGVTEPGGPYRPEEQIFQMSDRLVQTAREYRTSALNFPVVVLIASRKKPALETPAKPSEFLLIQQELINLGVARTDIYDLHNTFDATFNVQQTSEAIREYIIDRNISNPKIVVVADPMDVGRVKLTLQKTLSENQQPTNVIPRAWGLSSKFCPLQSRYPSLVDLIPNDSSVLRSSRFVDEFFTSSYYYLRNWLEPCWDCWDAVNYSADSNS